MKKIVLLALALILAVGGLGVGFAHWSGTLDISGSVQMSNVCVGWYQVSIEDAYSATGSNNDFVWDPQSGAAVQAGQDIGWADRYMQTVVCTCDIPGLQMTNVTHYKTIVITLNNAYPYYYVDYQVHFHNCGLPVNITAVTVTAPPQLQVTWSNGAPPTFKMETCQWEASSLEVWCKQPTSPTATDGVQPGQTYTFTVTIAYEQWQ